MNIPSGLYWDSGSTPYSHSFGGNCWTIDDPNPIGLGVNLPTEMTESPIEIVFTYTRDEYVRAIRRHYKTRMHVIRDVIGGILAVAGGLYLLRWGNYPILGWFPLIAGVILLAMNAYVLLLLPVLIYRWDPKLRNEYRLSFSEEEIGFQTDDINSALKWPLYHSWIGDDDFYILYHGKRDVTVIPRRAFSSKEDDSRFAKLLTQKIRPA